MIAEPLSTATWQAFGTNVVVGATRSGELEQASRRVREVLAAIDGACSRFRDDSEIARVNRAKGAPVRVSETFVEAARCALWAARITDGDLDPTIGASLRAAGYDRDFAAIRSGDATVRFTRAAGWRCVHLDEARGLVRVPPGVELDFGATAKAFAADLGAATAAQGVEGGVIVSIGGDLATAGAAPEGGWPVRVCDDHAGAPEQPGQTIALGSGGLATSSTTVRRWSRGGKTLHHILDPTTGAPVPERWRTVSVAAASCVDANIAGTTAIIRGDGARDWLEAAGLPARLVSAGGDVTHIGGWPADAEEPRR
jgi:thiamine biosynthesis lipoprotein